MNTDKSGWDVLVGALQKAQYDNADAAIEEAQQRIREYERRVAIMTREKPQDAFDFERAVFDCAMQNIAVRARQRRREAIHDGLLVAGAAISGGIATFGCILFWLLINGRL